MSDDDKFGVLLFENAWSELGKAFEPYVHDGNVGKYIYCKNLVHFGNFVELTIIPSQVADRIRNEMKIQIHTTL